jgi:hypothetical protein
MSANTRWFGMLLGGLLSAVAAGSEPNGYSLPWIAAGPMADLPYVSSGQVDLDKGVLDLAAGQASLRSHAQFEDFELEFQWRTEAQQDGGILLFGDRGQEVKSQGSSELSIDLTAGTAGRLIHDDWARPGIEVPAGRFHTLRLSVTGDAVQLHVNGQRCWEIKGMEVPIGWLTFRSGPHDDGRLWLKEIRMVERNHRSLFNGTDLTGWEGADRGAEQCWDVRDGILLCTGERGPWLRSVEQFDDFNFRLEYKLRSGGNSGVYLRVPSGGNHHGDGSGIEVQILDDGADRYQNLKPYQYCGSLYAIVPADPRISRPAGQWNTLEIDCRQTAYRVVHNGVEIINTDADQIPELGRRRTVGYLGLQNHSEEVGFRHLRIGPSMLTTGN